MICKFLKPYIDIVENDIVPVCREQKMLVEHVKRCFETEDIYVDEEQAEKYLALQKYFPYKLFEWEVFCFVLHCCTYKKSDGLPRWPILFIYVGRGAGKNGYLTFEDFSLLTPINGIMNYNIDIFAVAEDVAKTSFDEVWQILDDNKAKMKNHFSWTKEKIENLKTHSVLRFRTANARTKDGGRPGKVDYDEVHQYDNYKLIDVGVTGLGKKEHPRRTYISTDGDVRDGPLDDYKKNGIDILEGKCDDGGFLPFMCALENDDEISNPRMWVKANPSLEHFPNLKAEMELELEAWKRDPIVNSGFATKRCNRPYGAKETGLTSWENILACGGEMPDLTGKSCIFGIDYSLVTDFATAVLLFCVKGRYYLIQHTWICKASKDLERIRFPYMNAVKKGDATLVDDVEIPGSFIAEWLAEQSKKYRIITGAVDTFRYSHLKDELAKVGITPSKDKDRSKLHLLRQPSDLMIVAPKISTVLERRQLTFGDVPIMRWFMGNVKKVLDDKGNTKYEKVEQRTRKTDGAMAFIMAMTQHEKIDAIDNALKMPVLNVQVYR